MLKEIWTLTIKPPNPGASGELVAIRGPEGFLSVGSSKEVLNVALKLIFSMAPYRFGPLMARGSRLHLDYWALEPFCNEIETPSITLNLLIFQEICTSIPVLGLK